VRAIVVSTDPGQRAALGQALEAAGLRAELLADLAEAERRLAEAAPELLVLDCSVPRLDLLRAYAALRASPSGADTPLIFSRYRNPRLERDGADYYLSERADPDAVAALAREVLAAATDSRTAEARSAVVVEPSEAPAEGLPAAPAAGRGRRLGILLLVLALVVVLLFGGAVLLMGGGSFP